MKNLLIDRLIELAIYNSYFPKSTMRWSNAKFNEVSLYNMEFNEAELQSFSDDELLDLYSLIILRMAIKM